MLGDAPFPVSVLIDGLPRSNDDIIAQFGSKNGVLAAAGLRW